LFQEQGLSRYFLEIIRAVYQFMAQFAVLDGGSQSAALTRAPQQNESRTRSKKVGYFSVCGAHFR
jgi:hypothetical protein